jgi:hypothetical protein
MLFSDVAHRHLFSITIRDGQAEYFLREENPIAVVSKGAMSEVRDIGFRLVEPVMNSYVVGRLSAKFLGTDLGVFKWVGHNYTSYVVVA